MVETYRYAPLEGSCGHFAAYVLGSGNYYIFKTIHTFVYFRNGIREHYQFQLHEWQINKDPNHISVAHAL